MAAPGHHWRANTDASRREYAISRIVSLAKLPGFAADCTVYWLVTAIIFAISGVPNAIVLGRLVSIPQFIPQGGGLVSAILVFVVTMITGSTTFVNRFRVPPTILWMSAFTPSLVRCR
jgi:hypothetical protein